MANRLAELRKEKGVKQIEIANALGVKPNTVSGWEAGRRQMDHQALTRLADYFGVSIDYILCRDDNPGETEKAPDTANAASEALTEKEKEFLTYAGQMSEEQKGFLVAVMRALIEQGPEQSPGPPAGADERA